MVWPQPNAHPLVHLLVLLVAGYMMLHHMVMKHHVHSHLVNKLHAGEARHECLPCPHPRTATTLAQHPVHEQHHQTRGGFDLALDLQVPHHPLIFRLFCGSTPFNPPFPITPFTLSVCLWPLFPFSLPCYLPCPFVRTPGHARRSAPARHLATPALWQKPTGQN